MRAHAYSSTQSAQRAEYLLDDPSTDLLMLHDLRQRARDGQLRIVLVSQVATLEREVHTVSETPIEGSGAVARWVALLDRAEHLRQDSPSDHPTVERQIARAIDSLFRYEHQMVPATRRQAREYLWQRDRAEPLPPPQQRTEWQRCRCRKCLLARLMQRPAIAQQLGPSAPGGADPVTAPVTPPALAPATAPLAFRPTKGVHARRPAQRRLLPSEAQAS
jgi:hypothetical protein